MGPHATSVVDFSCCARKALEQVVGGVYYVVVFSSDCHQLKAVTLHYMGSCEAGAGNVIFINRIFLLSDADGTHPLAVVN